MPPPRTNGRIFLKILLDLVGAIIAEFGILAVISHKSSFNTYIGYLMFPFSLIGLIGSIFFFF
jgi:hypothetical protein